jgi:CO/xanthine dehydrogenase FAD-binding subunit
LKVYVPRNETQVLRFLSVKREDVRVIAGGTSLIPNLRGQRQASSWLADISHLSHLRYIRCNNDTVRIGALTRIRDLDCNILTKAGFNSFAEAARNFGNTAIANMATVGGNVATALPTSDLLPVLLSVDANVQLKSFREKRIVSVPDFLVGKGKTGRRPDELLTEVSFHIPHGRIVSSFRKIGKRSSNYLALVSLAVFLNLDRTKTIKKVGVAFNETSQGIPGRAREVEETLKDGRLTEDAINKATTRLELNSPAEPASEILTQYRRIASRNLLRDQLRTCRRMGG